MFVHHSVELYGSDRILLSLVTGLDHSRFTPIVVVPDEGLLTDKLTQAGIETHILPIIKLTRNFFSVHELIKFPFKVLESLLAFQRLFKGRHIDIVHSNTLAVLSGALWANLRKIWHIWHVHEIILHPAVARKLYPHALMLFADKVAAISQAVAHSLTTICPSLAEKIDVVWNGIDEANPPCPKEVKSFRQELGLSNADLLIVLVGRINRWKGHALFVEAAERLIERGVNNAYFFMAGGPPPGQEHFRQDLVDRIKLSSAQSRIRLLDYVEEIRTLWEASDICVVPSIEPEPFGMVALEAMVAAKPVIGADHGGLSEIVIDGYTGFLFEPGSVEALTNRLAELVNNESKRKEMGENGRKRAKRVFSLQRYVRSFETIYELAR